MQLNQEMLINIANAVSSTQARDARSWEYKKFQFFNGENKGIILDAIRKEFKKTETIEALSSRLIPINIMRKVIDKLSGLYIESPERRVDDENESDQELVEIYEDALKLNQVQKEANKYFKLYKRNLKELFVSKGRPCARNIPKHQYEVFSFNTEIPTQLDVVCKIIFEDAQDGTKSVFDIWSDENYVRVNGEGRIDKNYMASLKNPDCINPYGELPFVYINESSTNINPLQDDDLINVSIAVPIMISDLCFSAKFQSWSIIYTIGSVGDVAMNPNSVLSMEYDAQGNKPEIGTVKPTSDSDKVMELITNIVAILLSTKGLSASTIKTTSNVSEVISGVAKMLDSAENVEGRQNDADYFLEEESEMWRKLSQKLIPVWIMGKKLDVKYNSNFSPDFDLSVVLRQPKVLLSEGDLVEIATKKITAKLSTPRIELERLYPDFTEEQLDTIWEEIEEYNNIDSESQIEDINKMNGQKDVEESTQEDNGGVQSDV